MQKILIIGATSSIAEQCARIYAARASHLYLIARDQNRLQTISGDLATRGATAVTAGLLDVTDLSKHVEVLDEAWHQLETVDVAIIAHGTLPDQAACDQSPDIAVREFTINATATIALMVAVAERMKAQPQGAIAVISSVAGDRGRASNYLYGAAKAAVSTFASGMRQQLNGRISVTTIKPGFVDTPMTAAFKKGLLWASAPRVAHAIVHAIDRRRAIAYVPGFWRLIMWIIRSIPESIFRRIKL